MEWYNEHENLLKEWAEKARFYAWMHRTTSADYGKLHNMLTIPMIIISIVDGSANFTMVGKTSTSFLYNTIFPIVIGSMSLLSGVLSALTKYLKTAELAEKHELFYRQFNSFVRNISLDLSLPATERKTPSEVLNMYRYEFDRLLNEAPRIPEHVVAEFNKRFPYKKNKPEIASAFSKIVIHGRNENYKKKIDEFVRIRYFYKWKASKHIIGLDRHDMNLVNRQGSIPEFMKYNDSYLSNIFDDSTLNGSDDNESESNDNLIPSINIHVPTNEEKNEIEAV